MFVNAVQIYFLLKDLIFGGVPFLTINWKNFYKLSVTLNKSQLWILESYSVKWKNWDSWPPLWFLIFFHSNYLEPGIVGSNLYFKVQSINYYLISLNLVNEDIKICITGLLYGWNKAGSFFFILFLEIGLKFDLYTDLFHGHNW